MALNRRATEQRLISPSLGYHRGHNEDSYIFDLDVVFHHATPLSTTPTTDSSREINLVAFEHSRCIPVLKYQKLLATLRRT